MCLALDVRRQALARFVAHCMVVWETRRETTLIDSLGAFGGAFLGIHEATRVLMLYHEQLLMRNHEYEKFCNFLHSAKPRRN